MKELVHVAVFVVLGLAIAGCSRGPTTSTTSSSTSAAKATDGSKYLLASEPQGAKDVIQVRQAAKEGDEIVIVGRIGGSQSPWVDGRAAFSIVDPSLKACSDIPGDACTTPWDYCCETDKLPKSTAFVQFVDENGSPVKSDARELLNVKELQTVVIRGKAKRDPEGNLTVQAKGVYVRK